MNIQTVITNLLTTIAGKEELLKRYLDPAYLIKQWLGVWLLHTRIID